MVMLHFLNMDEIGSYNQINEHNFEYLVINRSYTHNLEINHTFFRSAFANHHILFILIILLSSSADHLTLVVHIDISSFFAEYT